MGRDIHSQVLTFFREKMSKHGMVISVTDISDDKNYIFRIERRRGLPPVTVFMSDTYFYGVVQYADRPKAIKRGDFILIAKPHGSHNADVVAEAKRDRIGLGKIGKLMGALHHEKVWQYKSQEEKTCETLERRITESRQPESGTTDSRTS